MKYIEEGRKMKDKIIVKGARVHNLKNVSLEIPRDKLIVFTGLSGSGKSSLWKIPISFAPSGTITAA